MLYSVDAPLAFDVLMYINLYYFPMSVTCNAVMSIAKFMSNKKDTPDMGRDAIVQAIIQTAELTKLLLFKKFRETNERAAVGISVGLSLVVIGGFGYIFGIQDPVLKLEYILDSMMAFLLAGELFYGAFILLPCFKQKQIY